MKTDGSIKNTVTAAIRRHSMDLDSWTGTRLWEAGDPERVSELLAASKLVADELPILYSYCDAGNWTLVTTRTIWSCDEGHVASIAAGDVETYAPGNFKGVDGRRTERMAVTSRAGVVHRCPYETGKPSMGTIYAVRTLLQLRRS